MRLAQEKFKSSGVGIYAAIMLFFVSSWARSAFWGSRERGRMKDWALGVFIFYSYK